MLKFISFILIFLWVGFSFAQSVLIEGNPYGNNPYEDISSAISDANDGDVILITGEHTETLSFNKSITLRGTDPTTDIIQAATSPTSDGSGSQVISIFANPANSTTITIENLGIRHGNQGGVNGGGIDIDNVTGLITLRNLIIEDNFTNELGGGVAIAGSNADIIDCTIRNNESVKAGGGLIVAPNNDADLDSNINIKQSLIDNNQGKNGGGLYINGNPEFGDDYRIFVDIENSTISNNFADSGSGDVGGGSIWSKASTWTTSDAGDDTSTNVYLTLIHSTLYNNSHAAANKNGIRGTGNNETDFSAYNSIIVNADVLADKSVNFLNINTVDVVNCILGGLQNAGPSLPIIDDVTKNNVRGKTATFAGLSGSLTDDGGYTEVLPISIDTNADDYCTASITGVNIPAIDQRNYDRVDPKDAGAYEIIVNPNCRAPESVSLLNLAATGASFSWAANPDATSYNWAVTTSGGDPDTSDVVISGSSTTNRASTLNLENETDYDFFVKCDCNGTLGDWFSAKAFTTAFQGNTIKNSRFTGALGGSTINEWEGYGTNARVDDIIGKNVGFINVSEGLFRQDFVVVPGVTYSISYNYRWVSASGGTNPNALTPVIRDPNVSGPPGVLESLNAVQTNNDVWYSDHFLYTHPVDSELDVVRLQFFKFQDINEFVLYNATVLEDRNLTTEYDFVYQNETWTPNTPDMANSTDDVYVFNGRVELNASIDANDFIVSPWTDVDLYKALKVSNEFRVEDGGVLTFKSNDNETAVLDDIGTANVSGVVTVERRIPQSNRAFRYISSPVNTTGSIRDNLQEGQNNPDTSTNLDNIPGYGTHITGSMTDANGFDVTQTGNPSMYSWVPSGNPQVGWTAIPNTNTKPMNVGEAYALMIRGDRSTSLNSNTAVGPGTTLRFTGELHTGGFPVPSENFSTVDGFSNLIANPYQSQVDLKALLQESDAVDVNDVIVYIYDPTIGTLGGYATVDLDDGSSTPTNPANNGESTQANQYLQPNQAFFVTTIDSNADTNFTPEITFREQYKREETLTTGTFSDNVNPSSSININLKRANSDILVDGVTLKLNDSYADAVNYKDAGKAWNFQESIAFIEDNNYLSINKKSKPVVSDTIQLYNHNYQEDAYKLDIIPQNIDSNSTTAYLKDNYLDTQIELDMSTITTYNFSVNNAVPASSDPLRFSIIFENETLENQEFTDIENFSIHPNPSSGDTVYISAPDLAGQRINIELTDLNGRVIHKEYIENFDEENPIRFHQSLSSGLYFVKISHQDNSSVRKLVVK